MSEPVDLDIGQEQAVSASAGARLIVIAGPGAGKSEVVGERCRRLVEIGDVYPEEILVISFSNVAVHVVRERTKDVIDEGRGVDCATIDSLAARIRGELEDGDLAFTGYDDSIKRATRLLRDADEPVLPDVRHVIVDEVQDVVGVRASFVLALLDRGIEPGIGFTLLGDPLQSLYDFQAGKHTEQSADDFLDAVRQVHDVEEIVLSGEYRSRTPEARAVARSRQGLLGVTPTEQLLRLRGLNADLDPLGDLDEDAVEDVRSWPGTTALLCDTNARAGLVAARFSGLGLPVELAAAATDPSLAPWIAEMLGGSESAVLTREEFLAEADDIQLEDPELQWRTLGRVAGARRDLDLRELASGLTARRYPLTLVRRPAGRVTASTVHRAKGQEFDNVVLIDPEQWFDDPDQPSNTVRRLFVAMTRGRSRLTRGRGISTNSWRKDARSGVWRHASPRGRGSHGLLVEPRHVRHLGPTTVDLRSVGREDLLWDRTDDLVTVDGDALPSWNVRARDSVIARTGEEFGLIMKRLVWGSMPRIIGGAIDGLETLAGDPTTGDHGHHGLWLSARISGPIVFDWKGSE